MGIQTIGLGSDSKLTMDTIDKLKEVDRNATVVPIEDDITEIQAQKEALTELSSLLSDFQSATSNLADENLYLNRTGYVSGEGINVTIDKGVSTQTMSIDVNQLAQSEIIQSDSFTSSSETIANGDGTLDIEVGGTKYSFDVTSSTTLAELATMINNDTSIPVTAKVLNTGTDEYRLILSGDETGKDNSIKITESSNLTTNLSDNDNIVQEAKDAEFLYNGVSVSRSSNTITDLVVGVNLELTQVTDQAITIDIQDDIDTIASSIQTFVDSYNSVMTKFAEVTAFDEETKETGVFQGNGDIRNIERSINKLILATDSNNKSLADIGLTLNDNGVLSFDSDTFYQEYKDDPDGIQTLLLGENETVQGIDVHTDGLFYEMDNQLETLIGTNSVLTNLSTSLDSQTDRLNVEKEKAITLLDNRYNRMAEEFARQDAIIAQIEQQFKALQMQIDMDTAKK